MTDARDEAVCDNCGGLGHTDMGATICVVCHGTGRFDPDDAYWDSNGPASYSTQQDRRLNEEARFALDRFERAIRNVEAHLAKHRSDPPDALWAEERIARRKLVDILVRSAPTPKPTKDEQR